MTASLLPLPGVTKRFSGLLAVDGVTMDVAPEKLVGIIGPNGAGKTTLFNLLAGQLQPSAGRAAFEGAGPLRDQAGGGIDGLVRRRRRA